jgi:hypothetical protein
MPKPVAVDQANNAIERFLRRADAIVQCSDPAGRAAARALLQTLVEADQSMGRRLEYWTRQRLGGGSMRFSEASLIVYREQVQAAIALVQDRLLGITNQTSLRAARVGLSLSNDLFNQLERAFVGIVRPIPIDEAAIMRLRPSLLARHATSVDRYGRAMVDTMERMLSQGLAEGITQSEMVQRLVGIRGPTGMVSMRAVEVQPGVVVRLSEDYIPEGLFVRHRSWAWRIVRTETAEAQNAANEASIDHASEVLQEPVRRKILAVMDNRTAADSLAVHGQIRAKGEYFVDGAGRRYLRPPARPHDRETLIPWRDRWQETPRSRPLSVADQERMEERNAAWRRQHGRTRRRAALLRKRRIERALAQQQAGTQKS